MYFLRSFLFLCVLNFGCLAELHAQSVQKKPEMLVFSQVPTSHEHQLAAQALKKLYGRLGISVTFEILPPRRGLISSNEGKTDGVVLRVANLESHFPNLVRIPTNFLTFAGYAYTKNGNIISSWEELKSYRVGIQRGAIWAEREAKGATLVHADSSEALLDKLLMGGVDVAIMTEYTFKRVSEKHKGNIEFFMGKPLALIKSYHYLNSKFAYLVDQVDAEMKTMSKTGEIEKITGIPNKHNCQDC